MDLKTKLEIPGRIAELNPRDTLERIGLKGSSTFCDVGAGTGVFTFEAAQITDNKVYAVEISSQMMEILQSKVREKNLKNVEIINGIKGVPDSSCDVVLLCTVLHEVPDVQGMMNEIKRILAEDGILAVIEFHKHQTPGGPPMEIRLDSARLEKELRECGLHQTQNFTLGENFYCSVFHLKV
ncbi:MAG: methyltransferase domain-containing protein [Muricomes sp.]